LKSAETLSSHWQDTRPKFLQTQKTEVLVSFRILQTLKPWFLGLYDPNLGLGWFLFPSYGQNPVTDHFRAGFSVKAQKNPPLGAAHGLGAPPVPPDPTRKLFAKS
jgi:hypothetical protein